MSALRYLPLYVPQAVAAAPIGHGMLLSTTRNKLVVMCLAVALFVIL